MPTWRVLRDLEERLPAMILPSWTDSRIQPVSVDDVVRALAEALVVPLHGSQIHELPGPETLSVKQMFGRIAKLRGRSPRTVAAPLAFPWLSSLWLRFVSSADRHAVERLVARLGSDLLAPDHGFWPLIRHAELVPFDEAVLRAFEDEALADEGTLAERAIERVAGWMTRRAA
jgi:hypothetical protein